MKLRDALIAWNPNSDEIEVGPLLYDGDADWTTSYAYTGGAAYVVVRGLSGDMARLRVMSTFIGIIVRDGVSPAAAHREFIKIEEYRASIPEDMEGAK